jgi:hypothetical protein
MLFTIFPFERDGGVNGLFLCLGFTHQTDLQALRSPPSLILQIFGLDEPLKWFD